MLLTVRNFSIFIFISVESVLKTKEDFIIYFASEACWGVLAYIVVLVWFQFKNNVESKEEVDGSLLDN